jgi:phospholipase/carboxylesterase
MNSIRQETHGSLRCIVVDGRTSVTFPEPIIPVVVCHGYGAPGDDLVGIAMPLIERLAENSGAFRFYFPEAPIDLSAVGMVGGRAWWPINMATLQQKLQTDRFDELHDLEPPGIVDARDALTLTLASIFDSMPNGFDRAQPTYVLGGFSQGAMLAMESALRGPAPPPQLLVEFSGTMVCQSDWKAKLHRLSDTTVLQSHGRSDFILPFSSAMVLRDFLTDGGIDVDFIAFNGPHTIPSEAILRMANHLTELVADVDPIRSGANDGLNSP